MTKIAQQTLTGETTDAPSSRTRPETMCYCGDCDDWILRSERHDHPHDVVGTETVIEQQRIEDSKEKVPDHANLSTATYRVEYTYEVVEVICVEACGPGDARDQASHKQTYEGEFMDTLHTRTEQAGEESLVSLEYLELNGLLPENHDVTEADIRRACEADLE